MHSDHCAKKLLPWFDGMLEADEAIRHSEHGRFWIRHDMAGGFWVQCKTINLGT